MTQKPKPPDASDDHQLADEYRIELDSVDRCPYQEFCMDGDVIRLPTAEYEATKHDIRDLQVIVDKHVTVLDQNTGERRLATKGELLRIVARLESLPDHPFTLEPEDSHPFPIESSESVPVFESTAELLEWWPDKELRQRATKRIGDEASDLQPLIAAGRHNVVLFRKVCTWGWILKEAGKGVGAPFTKLLKNVPGLMWTFVNWLFTKP
jgi:hypothetical protein